MSGKNEDDDEKEDQPVNTKGELPTLDAEAEDFIDEANEDKAVIQNAGIVTATGTCDSELFLGVAEEDAEKEDAEEELDDDEPPVKPTKPKRLTKKQKNAAIVERIRSCRKEMILAGRLPKKKKRM
jgi:hypothetical protein